jgi:hypothetical protein
MKRFLVVALGLVVLTACDDAVRPVGEEPEIGRPNIAITNAMDTYGFVDEFFSFLKPLVDDPQVVGTTLNTNLLPVIELWQKDQLVIELPGTPHACTGLSIPGDPGGATYSALAVFTPEVNLDGTAYHYGWKSSDEPVGGLQELVDYRLCVKITLAAPGGALQQVVGWRDVRPEKSTDPNNPAGVPYLFENGRNIPIEFWLSSKSQCYDALGNVIDCTIATFDYFGGTATCDDAQCGWFQPEGGIPMGELQTFEIRYVTCTDYNDDNTIEYLDIANPQYFGCLEVTTYASYDWETVAFPAGAIAASCRDVGVLGPQDERLLLHVEAPFSKNVYALPTRPFDLNCVGGSTTASLAPDASFGEKLVHYARRGVQTVLPWASPPPLEAAHAGFGGGTSLSCRAPEAFDEGPQTVGEETCASPALTSGPAAVDPIPAGDPVTFRMVWALPAKISARLQVTSLGPPLTTTNWIDPVSASSGETLRPAVLVTDECEPDSGDDGTGTIIVEDCSDVTTQPAVGAKVTFELSDGSTVVNTTGSDGIAYAPWLLTSPGLYTATASGLGIGVDPSLASVTLSPPPAEGAYQDHIGNLSVLLLQPKVQFTASVCSDKEFLLGQGVDPSDYDGSVTIPISLSGSDSDVAYLYWATDCYRTYFAFVVPQAPDFTNTLRLVFVDDLESRFGFDPANPVQFSAVPDIGDDLWLVAFDKDKKSPTYQQWQVEDWHIADDCTGNSKQSECGKSDLAAGHTDDLIPGYGGGAYLYEGGTVYEFARVFPADPADADPFDFSLPGIGESEWIAFYLTSNRGNAPQADLEWPDFRLFYPIEIVRQ